MGEFYKKKKFAVLIMSLPMETRREGWEIWPSLFSPAVNVVFVPYHIYPASLYIDFSVVTVEILITTTKTTISIFCHALAKRSLVRTTLTHAQERDNLIMVMVVVVVVVAVGEVVVVVMLCIITRQKKKTIVRIRFSAFP